MNLIYFKKKLEEKLPFLKGFFPFLEEKKSFLLLFFITVIFFLCYFESLLWHLPGPKATHGIAKGLSIFLFIFLFLDRKFKGYRDYSIYYMSLFFISYVISTAFSLDIESSLLHMWYPFMATLLIFLFKRVEVTKKYIEIVLALSMFFIFITFSFSFFSIIFRYSVDNIYYFIFLDHRANHLLGEIRTYGKYVSLGPYIMLIPLVVSFLIQKSTSMLRRNLSFLIVLMGLMTAVISNNRIDVLIFFIHSVIYFFLLSKRQVTYFILPFIFVISFGLFVNQTYFGFNLEQRILRPAVERDQETITMRFTYWETAISNFKNFPLFGTGPNTYNVVSDFPLRRYYSRGVQQYTIHPDEGIGIHNLFLERLSDTGIFGFFSFSVLLCYFAQQDFISIVRLNKKNRVEGMKKYILFSLGSWTWILYGLTDNGYGAQGFMTFFFLRGLLPHVFRLEYEKKSEKNSNRS